MKKYAALLIALAIVASVMGFFGIKQYAEEKYMVRDLQEVTVEIIGYNYDEGYGKISRPWIQFETEDGGFIFTHNVNTLDIDALEESFVRNGKYAFLIDKKDLTRLEDGESVEFFGVADEETVYLGKEEVLKESEWQSVGGLVLGCLMLPSAVILSCAAAKMIKSKE